LEVRSLLSLPPGAIDSKFGTQGYVSVPLIPKVDATTASPTGAGAGAVEANGTIVLAGSYTNQGTGYFVVEELNPDGTPVASFGTNGLATIPVGASASSASVSQPIATSLVVQADGAIDVAGTLSSPTTTSNSISGIIQLTPTGTLDTSFGTQGKASLPALDSSSQPFQGINALTLTSSGQLIVAGEDFVTVGSATDPALFAARFNASGSLDTTFGTSGIATVPVTVNGITNNTALAVGVLPSGQVIEAGQVVSATTGTGSSATATYEAVLVGLNANGTLDTAFGGSTAAGKLILTSFNDLAVESTGQFVVLGGNELSRYNANGTLDPTFGTNGLSATIPDVVTPQGLTIQPNGQFLVAGSVPSNGNNPNITQNYALVRLDANGTIDSTFGNSSVPGLSVYSTGTYSGGASKAVLSSTGQIILTGYSSIVTTATSTTPSTTTYYLTAVAANSVTTPTPALAQPPADFDGSGKSNIAVYLTANGEFAYRPASGGPDVIIPFGIAGQGQTIPAPGDYTGAGQTEIAAYLPSLGIYAYRPANGGADVLVPFGIAGAGQSIPVPGDYFGTGVDDIAVYLPSIGSFGIRNPAGGPDEIIPFGTAGIGQSIPVPGDYFGTGETDIAVYLPASGTFAIRPPGGGSDIFVPFGIPGAGNTIPVPGDYDGSGRTELAVYLPKFGLFIYRPANGGPDVLIPFGSGGDGSIPDPGDYDGSGKTEIAIYNPKYATFAYRPANGGPDVIVPFGAAGPGASLPLAAPISSNISLSLSTGLSALSVSSSSVSTESVTPIKQTALVPAGPKAKVAAKGHVRIASTLPAQADPSKPKA
jgi:uncharacterized delta-60 repeat protein